MEVHYRAEPLFFNHYVRSGGRTPARRPELYFSSSSRSGPMVDVFRFLVEEAEAPEKRYNPVGLIRELFPGISWPEDPGLGEWLEYAGRLGLETRFEPYISELFRWFGTSFDIPPIHLCPVLLLPHPRWFGSFIDRTYCFRDVIRYNPASYNPRRHRICLPIPERSMQTDDELLNVVVLHEIVHSPFRLLYGNTEFRGLSLALGLLQNNRFRHSSEILGNTLAALLVVSRENAGTRQSFEKLFREMALDPVDSCWKIVGLMRRIGARRLSRVLQPAVKLQAEGVHLLKAMGFSELADRELRGILRKRYRFKKTVRGMDRRDLLRYAARRLGRRFERLEAAVLEADPLKLLSAAALAEEDPEIREAMRELDEALRSAVEARIDRIRKAAEAARQR